MKTLEIEWKHLDKEGNTCIRCSDTGKALHKVVAELAEECRPHGWDIKFKETKLTDKEILESNIILLNGKPIEKILPNAFAGESDCQSCCKSTGSSSTSCRTIEFDGKTYRSDFVTVPERLYSGGGGGGSSSVASVQPLQENNNENEVPEFTTIGAAIALAGAAAIYFRNRKN